MMFITVITIIYDIINDDDNYRNSNISEKHLLITYYKFWY